MASEHELQLVARIIAGDRTAVDEFLDSSLLLAVLCLASADVFIDTVAVIVSKTHAVIAEFGCSSNEHAVLFRPRTAAGIKQKQTADSMRGRAHSDEVLTNDVGQLRH